MPIYEYWCPVCEEDFELRTDRDLRDTIWCPMCGANPERKLSICNFSIERNPPPEAFDERHGGKYPLPREDAEIY